MYNIHILNVLFTIYLYLGDVYLKLFSCELLLENVFANSSNNDNNSSNKTNSSTSTKNGANNSNNSNNNTNTKNTNYNTNLSSLVFPDDFASLADFYGENVRLARIIEDIVSDNYIGQSLMYMCYTVYSVCVISYSFYPATTVLYAYCTLYVLI